MITYNENIEQLINIAEEAVYEGDYQQASRLLYNTLAEEPGYAKLHYTLAWMYHYYQVNEDKAVRHYELAIYFDAAYEEAYKELVQLLMRKKKFETVHQLLTTADSKTGLDKDYVYEMLGHLAEKQAKFQTAISYYRKALIHSMDNDLSQELRKNIKRTRFKKIKTTWRWQRQS